jgi:predicted peptidase
MSKSQPDRLALYCPMLLVAIVAGCSAHRDQPAGVKTTPISTRPSPSLHKDKPLQSELEVTFRPASVTLDGATYRYAVYVPADYDADREWPALLFLNGSGERGDDGMKQTQAGIGPAIRRHPERFPCIVILPQCQPDHRWEHASMVRMAMASLADAQSAYRIDPRRIALTGLSLGGFGTWKLGAEHGEKFCALGPICGGGDVASAAALAKTPIWCFHGAADPVVPVEESRDMVAAVQAAGGDVRYIEFPGVGHNAWDPAYNNPEFVAWLLEKR